MILGNIAFNVESVKGQVFYDLNEEECA